MSGVAIIGELLNASTSLLAVVPTARIMAGALPQNITLPALAVTSISVVDRNTLKDGSTRRVTERVQVTVLAKNYAENGAVLALVRTACASKRGTFAGKTAVVVLLDGAGPDFMDDAASIWMKTQDFRVSFNEPA
jgi:hypothetical protein